eukprot:TRINITY_DN1216_c0_g4_i1.p1 TRINITY_DN1216_c0_g4~~TRINITY_DN1216_c0_g4_i1.p1  ORF type:complete len:459 (-),score=35.35 TRINITY_DN1216_c0_g4_i1:43-1419(-)
MISKTEKDGTSSEEEEETQYETCCFNKLFFLYMNKVMALANEREKQDSSLKEADLYKLPKENRSNVIAKEFWECFETNKSISTSLRQVIGFDIFGQVFLLFWYNVSQFAAPICLNLLLEFYTDYSKPDSYGYTISAIFVGILIFRTFMINHGNDYINKGVIKSYASMYSSIYKRLLGLIESSKGVIGSGRIVNFFTTDATFIAEILNMLNNVWTDPLQIIITMVLLYLQVEWCAFIGLGMFILMGIFQSMIMGVFIQGIFAIQKETDSRTKLLQEFLEGIRIIKYYAWERFSHSRIEQVRNREIAGMGRQLTLRTLYEMIAIAVPIFTMLIVFAVYSTAIGTLSVAKVFTVISLFKILQMPLWTLVTALILLAQTKASMTRVEKFYSLSANTSNALVNKNADIPTGTIIIEKAQFAWETPEVRKACEEFSTILEARFGKGPDKDKDKKDVVSEKNSLN